MNAFIGNRVTQFLLTFLWLLDMFAIGELYLFFRVKRMFMDRFSNL